MGLLPFHGLFHRLPRIPFRCPGKGAADFSVIKHKKGGLMGTTVGPYLIRSVITPGCTKSFCKLFHRISVIHIRSHIICSRKAPVIILLFRNKKISRKRLQHMLEWTHRRRISKNYSLSCFHGSYTVRDYAILCIVPSADNISRSCSGYGRTFFKK